MKREALAGPVRARLRRLPPPHASQYGVVPLPPPEGSIRLGDALASLQAAQRAIAEVETIVRELKDPFLISRVLIRNEAVSSSAIEGTHSTLNELLAAEESGADRGSGATRQVESYAVTLERFIPAAQRKGNEIFSIHLISQLHKEMMKSDRDYADRPGELRRRVVWIGGSGHIATSTYNPPPPEEVARCMREHVDYLRCEGMQAMTQDLVTRMAVGHAHFEGIHPFRDGNGRVGRLLLPLMMAADGHIPLYLSPYIEANKDHYYDALKAAQQRLDWSAIVGFMADAISSTVFEIKRTRSDLVELRSSWLKRRRFRANAAALKAMDFLHQYPVITTRRLESLLGVSFQAASTAVKQLVDIGVLHERTGYRRNRLFAAEEALRVLNRSFGETTRRR